VEQWTMSPEANRSDPSMRLWLVVVAAGIFFFLWLIFRSR